MLRDLPSAALWYVGICVSSNADANLLSRRKQPANQRLSSADTLGTADVRRGVLLKHVEFS